jgi:Putative porin
MRTVLLSPVLRSKQASLLACLAIAAINAAEPELPKADGNVAPSAGNLLLAPPSLDTLPAVQAPASATPSPTTNVTINLINALVKKGVLTAEEALAMVAQAEAEASQVQAQLSEVKAPPIAAGDVRVTYIPETVKNQIREGVKADMLAAIEKGDVELGGMAPEWTERIKWFGDFRFRSRNDIFPEGNDSSGSFPIFNSINTGAPFDVAGTIFSPQYNVDQDRYRMQLRARLGMEATLDDGWYAGMRFGTGETNTPVSQNQGLGSAQNGQGGNFSKYALWLDRAFLRYEYGSDLASNLNFYVGRFDNPFFTASEIMWNENIGFDGVALKGSAVINESVSAFAAGGLFPIFNTDFNFSTNQPQKFESTDKWLLAAQAGISFALDEHITGKLAAGYFDFRGAEGRLSSPYIPLGPEDAGDTDGTRPSFAQKGNTYRSIRQIVPSVINNFGTSRQYQYFGLATPFKVATLAGEINFTNWQPYQLTLKGETAKNTAFNSDEIDLVAVNNRGADPAAGGVGGFGGSDLAWITKLEFGKAKFEKFGDWSTWIDYRSVGSDALIDGFNDNYFGGGGTNIEGYSIGAQVALSSRVKVGLRWISANELTGPPLSQDIFLFDLSAKF